MESMSSGTISVIIGCMFSGKTSELIRIARRNKVINKKVLLINHTDDVRYSDSQVISHDLIGIDCIMCSDLNDIFGMDLYKDADIVCIDEGQFYLNLYSFCKKAANEDSKHVYVCGLDGDYKQEPFGEILMLIPIAEDVKKLNAFCKGCNNGNLGFFTKRTVKSDEKVLIGSTESYIPVCRKCLNTD